MTPLPRRADPIQAALDAHDAAPRCRRAEALADHSFRFDTAAALPPHPVPRPHPGEAWTLAQTLQEIRLRQATVASTSRGLRVRHAHRVPELAEAVRQHEGAVRLWLALGAAEADGAGWDDATALHARWVRERFRPGREAVALRPGVAVTDWPRFAASVEERLADGPAAPTADGLRRDLGDLFERYAVLDAPAVGRAPARAA